MYVDQRSIKGFLIHDFEEGTNLTSGDKTLPLSGDRIDLC